MNDIGSESYTTEESPSTPVGDSYARSHGETLKVMNPTPNGYNNVHSSKGDDSVKKHSDSSDSHKKKEHKSKDASKDGSSSKEHKEKKHHSSSKDSSKSRESSSSKHSSDPSKVVKKEIKHASENQNGDKPKSDNFKENEKNSSSKHKESKEKHKDKDSKSSHHKSSEDKDKNKGDKLKDKSDKHKDKSDKHKDKSDKHKDKSDKPKDKSEKHKDKSEKHKDKHSDKDKHKDKHSEKEKLGDKDKHVEKKKIKVESSESLKSNESTLKIKEESFSDDGPIKSKPKPAQVKDEPMSEDDEDAPLQKKSIKRERDEDAGDALRVKKKVKVEKKKRKASSDESDDEDYGSKKVVKKNNKKTPSKAVKKETATASPRKKVKKEEEQEVWKWWEEEKLEDGVKWKTLQHNGPVFAPAYERVPKSVKFYYDGKHMVLSEVAEEVAGFYGRMLDHEYTSKDVFNNNFFKDWRKVMTPQERDIIKDLKKCNFKDFDVYYKQKSEERKAMTKEEKLVIKKQNEELQEKYGFCIIDGHKQKIGNFRIEPPGLFRGRGEHPKMGMLKRRVVAEDILINIGKEGKVPDPPAGHKWKEVRHDNTVSWLASWAENILGSTKYVMLNPSSKLKGEKDWQKYETARKLKAHAGRIRDEYSRDFKSKEMKVRQRAVALYFIDKLALRAGNEKDEDTADTVGCCSLRVEHITLDEEKDGQEYVVSFDFLGKDSIRYFNSVPVEKRAFKNLKLFMENKQPGDDLFDRLNTSILNKYLNDLMEGLTAKVFRTYNASKTLQEQLDLLTKEDMTVPEKILAYNRANRAVAILCNHQRAVPKGFSKSMENLKAKMDEKQAQVKECKKELKSMKNSAKNSAKEKIDYEKKRKRLATLEEQLKKMELQATDKEENKQIALGTSKLNYLDPRISVGWCKKWGVPIEKIYNKTQRDKFLWAIEMAGPDYQF